MSKFVDNGPMLNAYPDSMGGTLDDIVTVLEKEEFKDTFSSFYILPSIYNTDLDRGFSVIDYGINKELGSKEDLDRLRALGIDLKLDFILNHASVLSPQFQDLLKNGEKSKYADFFINWNKFWDGCGEMTEEGYIQPREDLIKDMFFRKPGLPILMVRMPDGKEIPYWNTFYQEVQYRKPDAQDIIAAVEDYKEAHGVAASTDEQGGGRLQYMSAERIAKLVCEGLDEGKKPEEIEFGKYEEYRAAVLEFLANGRKYLGQMDLNIKSDLVWEHYENTLKTLAGYGAAIVRLDAFAYAPKDPGKKNFLNEPDTWDVLERVKGIADKNGVRLLPEIHDSYSAGIYEKVAGKGYMTYDFFLPGLLIYAMEKHSGEVLAKWANELMDKNIRVVNMLGCHDGIPVLDLKGFIPDEEIESLIQTIVGRGGLVKNLHGQKNMYYQVNATYYSALGADEQKMLFARAVQMFMPGKPQVWYLDLFAGENDLEAVKRAGAGGHKEINRTNLSNEAIKEMMKKPVVQKQLELLRLRNTNPAFGFDAKLSITQDGSVMNFTWENNGSKITLKADFSTYNYEII
ncbi:alpha-amylase family glycosyl hydrolase [Butyrivibrio sp. MB2005]|uniref:alpha-amylase family glycosyl hydrolase n=1 Tax=Butyrivibrio sp. MB2005 TaxID=1280678 RepID=UPI0003F85E8B|nr:alpha-amylase family glycosyl hydrolase [Butyrivibrio sp. MB2005]